MANVKKNSIPPLKGVPLNEAPITPEKDNPLPPYRELLGLQFIPPNNTLDCLRFIANISDYLNMFFCRIYYNEQTWIFSQMVTRFLYEDTDLWKVLAERVHDKQGRPISAVPYDSLGVCGITEAIEVFSKGVVDTEVCDILARFNQGITRAGIIAFMQEIARSYTTAIELKDPKKVFTTTIENMMIFGMNKFGMS